MREQSEFINYHAARMFDGLIYTYNHRFENKTDVRYVQYV